MTETRCPLPKMARIRQTFARPRFDDIAAEMREQMQVLTPRIRPGMTVRSPRSTTSSAWVKYEATSHLVPTASIRLPRTATKPSNGRSPVPVKTLLDVRTVKRSDITTTYTGSMPEIAVTIRPKTTMKMKNFQMVFHHWPNEILATARPATVMPATGLIVLMV